MFREYLFLRYSLELKAYLETHVKITLIKKLSENMTAVPKMLLKLCYILQISLHMIIS